METDNLVIKDAIVQDNVENTSEHVVEAEEIECELSVTPPATSKSEEISVINPDTLETNDLDAEKEDTLAEETVLDSLVEEKEVRIPVETVKKQHKRLVLADSDSEDEYTAVPVDKEAVENQLGAKDLSEDEETISKHPNRLDGDSEQEEVDEGQSDELKGKRIKALVDSDSEDEKQGDNVDVAPMYVVNHRGELILESAADDQLQKSRLAALCDSESEEENRNDSDEESAAPVNYKPTNKSKKRVDEPKKMTFKDAEQQKLEITADRQRSIREAQVSLPYHKPKMRTLKEFFASRPKPVTSLTLGTRPSVGIKIANEQIHEITRNLKTREKELKEFYKSESEAEDEEDKDDKDYVPSGEEIQEAEIELDAKITEIPTEAEELITEGDKIVEEKKLEVRKALDFSFDEDNNTEEVTLKNIEEQVSSLVVAAEIVPIETEPEPTIPKSKFELLKEKLANKIVPRLSVNPSESINLETGRTQLNEVDQLVERFIKHTSKQKVQKHQVELSVVSVSGGQIHKDTVAMRVDDEEELKLIEEKPGARFHKLRDELQAQMAQKRSELWALKKQNHKDEEIDEQKDDYEDDVILDDEEEEEMSCSDEEEEEIYENEEDDEELMDEVESKSEFIADEAEEEDEEEELEEQPERKTLRRIVTQADSDSDDEICAAQPLRLDNGTPQRPLTLPNHIEFLTPVSYITGLQNLNSASKLPKESPILERPLAAEPSPLKEANWQPGLQKKLFSDIESEEPLDESVGEDEEPSTQELLGVCSGQFTGVTQIVEVQEEEVAKEDFDHDVIISQLLDEDEMESFKKKFQSPLLEGGAIESDDEDGDLVRTKKKQKKLVFSDDEEDEEEEDVEERIDLHDEDLENIAYDSEENEVEVDANLLEEKKMKVKDFVENEAELSGSEWGSADEDEQDLDLVDFELGDNEKFDEDKLKRGLEKIHMRRILDDDTREVKLLQEMLLEDGELHGTGRERQFKWKNIDALSGDVEEEKKEGEEQYLDEEESEEQWRKQRHEREMFLKEQNNSKVDEDVVDTAKQLLDGSQLLIQRSQSLSLPSQKEVSTTLSQPLSLLSKRGSFLARGDEVLDRLAEFNKVTDVNLGSVKPSRNFLFSTVDATVDKKRKASDGTPTAIKKLRLSENFSPLVERKKNNRAKQLFSTGTW